MNLIKRLAKSLHRTQKSDEREEQIARIHDDLRDVRLKIRLLEMSLNNADMATYEVTSQEINAKREREHALIKEAKTLYGQRINIEGSLREYINNQSTIVPVQE